MKSTLGNTCAAVWAVTGPYLGENFPQNLRTIGFVAALVALVVALVVSIRRRKQVERVGRLAEELLTAHRSGEAREATNDAAAQRRSSWQSVDEITLVPSAVRWSEEGKWREWAAALMATGFERVGGFLIPELTLPVEIWINSKVQLTSLVFDHIKLGMWLELITRYADGTHVTFTNKKGGVAFSPGRDLVYAGQVGPEELLKTALSGRAEGELRRPTFDNAVSDLIDDWREQKARTGRHSRGRGPSLRSG